MALARKHSQMSSQRILGMFPPILIIWRAGYTGAPPGTTTGPGGDQGGSRRASRPVDPVNATLAAELLTLMSWRPAGRDQRWRCVDQSAKRRGSASTVTLVLAPGASSTLAQPIRRWPRAPPRLVT